MGGGMLKQVGSSELSSTVYPEAPILSDDPIPAPPSPSLSEPPSPPDSSLPAFLPSTSSFFTDPSLDIFLDDVDIGSSELSSTVYPEAPILSDDPIPAPPSPSLSEPPSPPDSSLPAFLPSTSTFTHDTTVPLRHSDRKPVSTPSHLFKG
ncbi:hypothetical protein RHGRI_029852 [Rhododendron griersonianum]|uniref:Uncharacterized protein n=1 Tax=Rhododendron griersonianum TaxID=479676 RepID=A0AAV6IKR5_9ERIC|nr:hypothetical protein RHGRI_029852 [Rhododendron griersonianum]